MITRLRQDLGINLAGIWVVLELLDRIESMEKEITRLSKQTYRDLGIFVSYSSFNKIILVQLGSRASSRASGMARTR
jgi:hypothetical protein